MKNVILYDLLIVQYAERLVERMVESDDEIQGEALDEDGYLGSPVRPLASVQLAERDRHETSLYKSINRG